MPPVERKGAASNSASGLRSGWLSASSSSACSQAVGTGQGPSTYYHGLIQELSDFRLSLWTSNPVLPQ